VLSGLKVVLRPWKPEDAGDVFLACQDPDIQRWTPVPSPYKHSDAIEYVTQIAPAAWAEGGAVFAVVEVATGHLAGAIGAHRMDDGIAHVGYWTRRAVRGKGLTTEALRTIAVWFLHEGGATRVELVVEPANVASVRVAEAAGFTREGVLRQRFNLRGRRIDVAMYSMLSTDPTAGTT
jgi:RimJ/RimL family protein N-acetyltransferase